jgi:MFS family permease
MNPEPESVITEHTLESKKLIHDESSEKTPTNFDMILNRIGMGFYHWKIWIIFGFLGWADGSESMVLSFIVPVFKKVYQGDYDFDLEAALGTFVYIGYFFGSLFSGFASDHFGRKKPVIFATIFMMIFCLASAFPPNLIFFIIFRSIFGMIDGFFSPLAYTYMAEMTPTAHRGKYMILLGINYTIGEIIACVIAIVTLDNFNTGNWHALLAWSTFPALLAFIASIFFLEESARYNMSKGKYQEGVGLLKKIWTMNRKKEPEELMTQTEEQELISGYEERRLKHIVDEEEERANKTSIKELFRGKFLRITLLSWFNWFANSLTFNGLTYILPNVLEKLNHQSHKKDDDFDVASVIYSCLSELPTVFIAAAIIDIRRFGRKNTMGLCFLFGGVSCVLASLQIWPGVIVWVSVTKFFFAMAWTLNFQFTSELYPTVLRGRGIGIASTFGRLGSVIMPIVCAFLFEVGTLVPFFMFGCTSLLAAVCTFLLPYDTAGMEIDKIDKEHHQ